MASAHNTQAVQKVTAPTTIEQDLEELSALLADSLTQTFTNTDTDLSSATQDTITFDTINEMFDQAAATLDQETKSYHEIYDSLNKKLDAHTCTLNYDSTHNPTPYVVPDSGATSSCAATDTALHPTGKKSIKTFKTPTGELAPATDKMVRD